MQALQVYRFIERVNHGMSSSRKSRHGTELQMPMICTGIMEMGNLRKHGKTEWKRSQKNAGNGLTPDDRDIILKI